LNTLVQNSLNLRTRILLIDIRISNISLNTTDSEVRRLFSPFGVVDSAKVSRNSLNGRSLRNGKVNMPVASQARQAIISLDKTIMDGRIISVSEWPSGNE
jgi:RNA recognition motif-containing protein